jgi:hypothetical protein
MRDRVHDALLVEETATRFDQEEWEWPSDVSAR